MKYLWVSLLLLVFSFPASSVLAGSNSPWPDGPQNGGASTLTTMTWTVNSNADDDDANIGDGVCKTAAGVCTLRAAIEEANAHAGPDMIVFRIPGGGVHTIQLNGPLPTLSDTTGPTTIDGYTQPGSAPNTLPLADNAVIRIEIRGNGAGNTDTALMITSSSNVVRGLAIYNAAKQIYLYGSGATYNRIVGNFIGTDAGGTFFQGPGQTDGAGVQLNLGPSYNRIGGAALAGRNVISGNGYKGIVTNYQVNNTVIQNNIIGLSPMGDRRLPNQNHGIDIQFDSFNNLIGGLGAGQRNVISGNKDGVQITHGIKESGNQIIGNYIGTGLDGTQAGSSYSYNEGRGIEIHDGANNDLVAGNVIANNKDHGIHITSNVTSIQIKNNRIGIGLDNSQLPNAMGIQIGYYVTGLVIGPNNIIANNAEGIQVLDATDVGIKITRNSIFRNPVGPCGRGIDLQPIDPCNPNPYDPTETKWGLYANNAITYPLLTRATTTQVKGTACSAPVVPKPCRIEIFVSDRGNGSYGEAKRFVAAANTQPDGSFVVLISGVPAGKYVTATATDAQGDTSEFSQNILVQ